MENPKLRIESDGIVTEVYIDGIKVEKATMADFIFHAEPQHVECEIERYLLNDNGSIRLNKDKTDALKVTEQIF